MSNETPLDPLEQSAAEQSIRRHYTSSSDWEWIEHLLGIIDGLRAQEIRSEGLVWKLADALMDMVNQHCHAGTGIVSHDFLSSNELAIEVLESMGLAHETKKGTRYMLDWDALKALEAGFRHGEGLPEPEQSPKSSPQGKEGEE